MSMELAIEINGYLFQSLIVIMSSSGWHFVKHPLAAGKEKSRHAMYIFFIIIFFIIITIFTITIIIIIIIIINSV